MKNLFRRLHRFVVGILFFLLTACGHVHPACCATLDAQMPNYYRFSDGVTDDSSKELIEAIHKAEERGAKTMVIEIDSPGGDVDAGFQVARAIEDSPVHIICVADGEADSMAFYILQSCGTRMMTKRTVLMTHQPKYHGEFTGTASDWMRMAHSLEATANAMAEHCSKRLKISLADYKSHIAHDDWFMNWAEALKVGAVDEVVPTVRSVVARYADN